MTLRRAAGEGQVLSGEAAIPAIDFVCTTMRAAARSFLRYSSSISSPTPVSSRVPWFIDSSEALLTQRTSFQKGALHPLPLGVPPALEHLHAKMVQSPYLEPSQLLVREPIPQPPGPPLPISEPKGRRKRGRTYAGEGLLEPGGIWNWIVLAQVCDPTFRPR